MYWDNQDIEKKWLKNWEESKLYEVSNSSTKPKYYVLDMFPYPSGAGLHVGHPLGYIASDIYARYKRMNGFNVLHPMGFDAFGLPAEEYALKTGIHPQESTEKNMARYREQLKSIGFSFDWSREIATCDPNYYKWTQWIFTLLFDHYYDQNENKAKPISDLISYFEKNGSHSHPAFTDFRGSFSAEAWNQASKKEQSDWLMEYRIAYQKEGYVNWCEELGTVLANDQIKDGVSERGGYPVVKKPMKQWYLRITSYAQRLLDDMESLDWSDSLKIMQSNWIGRSQGVQLFFPIEGHEEKLEIYTTRIDTIFGATYMVLAPEHPLVSSLTTDEQAADVKDYIDYVAAKSDIDRQAEKEVTGCFTGSYAINPFTEQKIPIWIGEYVLIDYGTGAIMAVPADDERDQRFAEKFGLEIIPVVDKSEFPGASLHDKVGTMINSEFLDGMSVLDAIDEMSKRVEEMGIGQVQINYKLRDANFSRQRYWGEPFPIVYNAEGIAETVPLDKLPVILPETDDFKPSKGGKSPLARLTDWVQLPDGYTRETDTMPAVAGSSWYYLRYMDPHNDKEFASKDAIHYWQSVDFYLGGAEHAVAHLLYARFWHKFLFDLGYVPTVEPFQKLVNQGKIQGTIESIFLDKDTPEGQYRFVDAKVAENEKGNYAKINVHIDYVNEYGTDHSHLTTEGLRLFVEWMPSYETAVFESEDGRWTLEEPKEITFYTHSESGKMSKSKFNVINPDQIIDYYGADVFRMYEMFLGPIEADKPWDTQGIEGVAKFIKKLISLYTDDDGNWIVKDGTPTPSEQKIIHSAMKKIAEDIERLSFNTCISTLMVTVNDLRKEGCHKQEVLEKLVQLLAPFAPFSAEELWERLGLKESVHASDFPAYDEKWLKEDSVEYPVCFNGKKRMTLDLAADLDNATIEKLTLDNAEVQERLTDMNLIKVIVVPKKMINLVVKPK